MILLKHGKAGFAQDPGGRPEPAQWGLAARDGAQPESQEGSWYLHPGIRAGARGWKITERKEQGWGPPGETDLDLTGSRLKSGQGVRYPLGLEEDEEPGQVRRGIRYPGRRRLLNCLCGAWLKLDSTRKCGRTGWGSFRG